MTKTVIYTRPDLQAENFCVSEVDTQHKIGDVYALKKTSTFSARSFYNESIPATSVETRREVLRIAANLKNEGYFSVKVDLPGCLKPDAIDGFYPDIQGAQRIVKKNGLLLLWKLRLKTRSGLNTARRK